MKKPRKTVRAKIELGGRLDGAVFWACVALLALVPLVFSTSVYTKYALPKFVVLLVGAAALLLLLTLRPTAFAYGAGAPFQPFRSRLVKLVGLYVIVIAV